jgi:glycosyltransferase involved in cell wall biosynthesis
MRLIIHAANVHQGGGRSLLLALLKEVPSNTVIIVDERLEPLPLFKGQQPKIFRIRPNLISRLKAEYTLKKITNEEDVVLCFGNLPPLFKNTGKVFIYLQNRYLCSNVTLKGFSWKIRLRITIERFWLKFLLHNSTVLVQSETMKKNAESYFNRQVSVLPFLPKQFDSHKEKSKKDIKFDYVYVASGEPHKNHLRLLEAWISLANFGLKPSLRLTLDPQKDYLIWEEINRNRLQFGLNINSQMVSSEEINELYQNSGALIYPSLFESFGLPLMEAERNDLAIIASERDYVRDIVDPCQTFDPESAISIARAVMRHMDIKQRISIPDTPEDFLHKLMQ